jgi:membrane protease YdiL (CAAX protease family)
MYIQPGRDRRAEAGGGPAGRRWWSILPPPAASPISARRAYAEVLGVVAAFFAANIIAAGESLSGRYPLPAGSWAVFIPAAVSELSKAGLAALVVLLLAARRGITPRALGLGWPAKASDSPSASPAVAAPPVGPAFRIAVWALMALVAGGLITSALATGSLGQPVRPDDSYLVYASAASLAAGVVEEMIVLAFVVTTLWQAARPLPEIVIVAVLLRCSYHIYYGPGVAGIAVWAAVFVWLFLRSGSVVPMIVVHFLWDLSIFFELKWHAFAVGRASAFVLLPIAAGITWLADRRMPPDIITTPLT